MVTSGGHMAQVKKPDLKVLELRRSGTLHPHPDSVTDALFKANPFFDPRDLLQVRYEMLRRHRVEGASIVDVAATFGISRPTIYRAQAWAQAFSGSDRVCAQPASFRFPLDHCCLSPSHSGEVWDHCSPAQSRAGAEAQKKTTQSSLRSPMAEGAVEAYEGLRREAVQPDGQPEHLEGRALLMRRGMAAWAHLRPSTSPHPLESHFQSADPSPRLVSPADEVVRLVASLILSVRRKDFLYG